ncbi:MAG: patatin-like phospholipase family protein [Alphaproteobacteria bacterium]|nr:patatin-like phospholipase family protein [Alphaproteobacteria bacterium]
MNAPKRLDATSRERRASVEVKRVNLALQGGSAHGAFTWGVLDRLLADERLEIQGISGTSAGAMNAAVLAAGATHAGRAGARQALEAFWRRISQAQPFNLLSPPPWERAVNGWNADHLPQFLLLDLISRVFSPYQLNPANRNPLRKVLGQSIDFECLREHPAVKLFISATNVRTGKVRVFKERELSIDALLASACLPFLFQSVMIDGDPYWDGGYMGNPSIFPLIYGAESEDVIVVQVNPLQREETPTTAREIMDRVNEISFNSSLMREMRAIAFVSHLLEAERLDVDRYKRMRVHWIDSEQEMNKLGYASKLNADWGFLTHLKEIGRQAAERWLAANYAGIGQHSTVDIKAKFL